MIWTKYKIETKVEATDIVASVLFENGIVGVEIEDSVNLSKNDLDKMYVDIPKVYEENDIAYVIFYVSIVPDKDTYDTIKKDLDKYVGNTNVDASYIRSSDNIFIKDDFEKKLSKIKLDLYEYQDFVEMGTLFITKDDIDDESFINKWKDNFKEIVIDNVSILPIFKKINHKDDSKINIFIDPGTAFGTGQHETTKLCVKGILDYSKNNDVSDKNFLDIGTGSGILAILAYKLGFKCIHAMDIDAYVEDNLCQNLKINNIEDYRKNDMQNGALVFNDESFKFTYSFGNIIEDKQYKEAVGSIKYDLITMNILAPVIINMLKIGKIGEMLSKNGHLILSGILKEHEKSVIDAASDSFKVYNKASLHDWVMIDLVL